MEQTTNFLPYFITGFVMMIVGWAMGFFDSNLRTSKKIKQAEASAEVAIREAQNKIAQAEHRLAATGANPAKAADAGLLRIRNENGSLTLDLDGSRVNPNALTADQQKRLSEMMALVRPWLEGKPVNTPAAPAPAPTMWSQPTTARPATIAKEDRPPAPSGSIVNQIDSILQAGLAGTPLEEKGVFLAESPEGGVMVYVGLTKYMGLDNVPDPEIKAAIRAAITEWENRYTPGL
jgi:hypothetical protein